MVLHMFYIVQDQMVCQIKKGPGVVDFISCPTGAACDESNSVYFKMASGEQLIISFCVLSTKNLMNALLVGSSDLFIHITYN